MRTLSWSRAHHPIAPAIVIRGESADTVIFSAGRLTLSDISWVYLENLGVQGEIRMSGSSNMVVRGCKINSKSSGITFQMGDEVPRNNFIVDNDVVGAANWTNEQLGPTASTAARASSSPARVTWCASTT